MKLSNAFRIVGLAAVILVSSSAHSDNTPTLPPPDAQATADSIARELEQIRGLTYRQHVRAETQSVEDFSEYVARQLDKEVPDSIRRHYRTIVQTLGLYRGPTIDFSSMMMTVMTSQVGAYYDPEKQSFFVVMSGNPSRRS